MTKLKLGVILCLLFSSSYAQKAKITLGEFDKFKGELVANIHTFGENEAYDVSVNNSLLASTGQRKMNIMMRHIQNNNIVKEVSFEGSFKIECYEGSALLVNNLVVVTSRENNKMKSFTAYKTRSDLTIGKTVTLFTLPASNKLTSKIEVYSSENNEYLLTVARNTDAYGKFDEYHYHVFDKNFETVVQGVNKLPGSKHANDKDFHYVSNTGEYFIGFKTYDANVNNRGKENKTKKTYSNYLIRRVNVEATRDFEIVLKQGYVKSLGFKVDENNHLIITGLWGEESNNVVGAFTQKIDLTSQKLVSGDSHLFSKEFMKEYWSGTSGMFEDSESNTISITNDYEFRTFIPTKDGYVALIEQAYIHCINGANGPICNDYTHGVIAYLVKTDGNIGWTTFIYKENKGKGTFGVSCSFGYLYNDEKIAVFFHDALDSYDTDGSYNNYRLPSKFSTKEYAFAQANIDISSGAITRHLAANAKELGGYPLPKYIARTKNPNEAVFVVITDFLFSKKRYGTLKI